MSVQTDFPKEAEFCFPDLDNHVLVENREDGVVIRATRDNISERRKTFFIREPAAEGYIPDLYNWFSQCSADGYSGVRWVIDRSWLKLNPEISRRTARFMRRLLACGGLLWLAMMGLVVLSTR